MTDKAERTIEKKWFQKAANLALGAIFAFLIFFLSALPADAGNQQVTFQGKLTNSSSNIVSDGTYYLKLTIYDAASGGSCQYTASSTCASVTSTPVTVTNGIFSINLGDTSASLAAISPTLFNNSALYLGITVCSGAGAGCDSEMTPRKRLTAAPYAFNADYLSGLATSTIGGVGSYVPVTDSSGNLKITNSLLIATTTAGQFGVGTSTVPTGVKSYVEGTTATDKLLVLRGNSSQSGNLQEWQNNAGTALMTVNSSGSISTSGTLATFGNATIGGHLYPSTDNLYDVGASSTQWRYGNFQGGILIANGSTTSTLLNNSLTLGQTTNFDSGKFVVDSSGNVSASGSLRTFGNVTSTGNLYALTGTASTSILNGSSLILGQGTGYNSGMFNIDSNGSVSASGSLKVFDRQTGAVPFTLASANTTYLDDITTQLASNNAPTVTIGGADVSYSFLIMHGAESGLMFKKNTVSYPIVGKLGYSDNYSTFQIIFGDGSSVTSTWDINQFMLNRQAGFNSGLFYIDASTGNVSASGTLAAFGNTTLSGSLSVTSNTSSLRSLFLSSLTAAPNTQAGSLYFNSSDAKFYGYTANGTAVDLGSSGGTNDWGRFSSTYGALALMTSSTYPVWFDGAVYASSTLTVSGATNASSSVLTGTSFVLGKGSGWNNGVFSIDVIGGVSTSGTLNVAGGPDPIGSVWHPTHKSSITDTASYNLKGNYSVFVSGNYAYIASQEEDALTIIDVSNPASTTYKGTYSSATLLNGARSVFVSGNYAYVVANLADTLAVIDISNPANPVLKGSLTDSANFPYPNSVFVSGNYAYVVAANGASTGYLAIIDISNPSNPVLKSMISDGTGGAALKGNTSVFVSGNYAYVTAGYATAVDALEIINISNPLSPTHAGKLTDSASTLLSGPQTVFVSGNYAYITATSEDGLEIVDISNPANPVHKGSIADGAGGALLDNPWSLFVSGNYAYVGSQTSDAVEIVDISNPANPVHKGSIANGQGSASLVDPFGIFVSGNYAYVVTYSNGTSGALEIIDVSGATISNARIGALSVDTLQTNNFAQFDQHLSVRGGLNVSGPAQLLGDVSIGGGRATSTNMGGGGLTIFTNQTSSTLTSRVFDVTGSTGFVFNSGTSTWTGSDRNLVSFQTGGTDKFLFAADGSTIVNKASGFNLGKFYVDSSGNTFASGSLRTFGNVTSTGNIYALSGSASTSILNGSSLTLGQGTAGYNSGMFNVDSNGNTSASGSLNIFDRQTAGLATISLANITYLSDPSVPELTQVTANNAAALSLGNYLGNDGIITLKGGSPSLIFKTMSDTNIKGQLGYNDDAGALQFIFGNGSSVTSTWDSNKFVLSRQSGYNLGKFYINAATGDVSASGSLRAFGNVTSTGNLYALSGSASTSILNGSSLTLGQGTAGYNSGMFNVDSNGNVSASGSLSIFAQRSSSLASITSGNADVLVNETTAGFVANASVLSLGNTADTNGGFLELKGGNAGVIFNYGGKIIGQLRQSSTGMSLILGDGSVTTTLDKSQLILARGANDAVGKFYVDSSGNTSVSGTSSVFGNSIFGDSDAAGGDTTRVYGSLAMGATPTGNAQLYLKASSTMAVPLLIQDNNGKTISQIASSSVEAIVSGAQTTLNGGSLLTLGDASGLPGSLSIRATADRDGGFIIYRNATAIGTQLTSSNLIMGDGSSTTTLSNTSLILNQMSGYNQGKVNINNNGNVSVSGTLRIFGLSGSATTGGLAFSATNSTTTLTSYATNAAGSTGFVFNTQTPGGGAFSSSTDRFLAVFQNASINEVLISAGGNVYAKNSFIANSTDYGIGVGDMAEFVNLASGETVEAGDVVIVDTNGSNQYRKSDVAYAKNVAGVISGSGAFLIGGGGPNRAPLALAGLVNTKVTDENGPIAVGDYLVSASKLGYAMKYDSSSGKPAGLVGMALEPLRKGEGKIVIMVNKGLVAGSGNIATAALNVSVDGHGQLVASNDLDMAGKSIFNLLSIKSKDDKWMIDEDGYLIVKVKTKQGEKELYGLQSGQDKELVLSGSSQLENGLKKIELPLIDQEVIDPTASIKVSVTLTGEAKGVFVSEKSYQGFTVKELGGGMSNATFDWMLIAKRRPANYQDSSVVEQEPAPVEAPAPVVPEVTSSTPSEESVSASAPIETPTETPPDTSPASEAPAPAVEPVVPPAEIPPATPAE